MKIKDFASGAGILALLSLIAKLIGAFYRIPLTNILGAEGMGLYQLIFPIYSVLLAISAGGIPTAISKYVSELNASGNDGKRVLKVSVVALAIVSATFAFLLLTLNKSIARAQGNENAASAYVALAPAVVFSSIIACYRGYFQGRRNMFYSGVSQIIEQVVKVVLGISLALAFARYGTRYAVVGAVVGITLSELAALFYLAVNCKKRNDFSSDIEAAADVIAKPKTLPKEILKNIWSVALPISVGSLVMPFSQVIDSFLIVNLLVSRGETAVSATALYGIFNGPVGSLINVPTVVTVAIAASTLPKVAYLKAGGKQCDTQINESVAACFALMIPAFSVFAIAPEAVLKVLYSGGLSEAELTLAATMLRLESVNVVSVGIIQISSATMQSLGKVKTPVINLALGAVIKVAATVTLVPFFGIIGAAISNVAFYAVTATLDCLFADRYAQAFSFKKQAKGVLYGCSFGIAFALYLPLRLIMSDVIALIIAAFAAATVYFALLVKTKSNLFRNSLL